MGGCPLTGLSTAAQGLIQGFDSLHIVPATRVPKRLIEIPGTRPCDRDPCPVFEGKARTNGGDSTLPFGIRTDQLILPTIHHQSAQSLSSVEIGEPCDGDGGTGIAGQIPRAFRYCPRAHGVHQQARVHLAVPGLSFRFPVREVGLTGPVPQYRCTSNARRYVAPGPPICRWSPSFDVTG